MIFDNIYFQIAILVSIFVLILILTFSKLNSKGDKGEKAVAKVLKKLDGKALNGICLPLYKTVTEIDHIFICKNGVVVIETKNLAGEIVGNVREKDWIHNIGRKTHNFYNPLFQNKTHCDNISHHLKKLGFNGVPMYSVVVFVDKNIRFKIFGFGNILRISALSAYINSLPPTYEKIPVKEIFNGLNSIKSTSKLKLLKHNRNIQKKSHR